MNSTQKTSDVYTKTFESDFTTSTDISNFDTKMWWPRYHRLSTEQQYYWPNEEPYPFRAGGGHLAITAIPTASQYVQQARVLSDDGRAVLPFEPSPAEFDQYAVEQPYISGVLATRELGYRQDFGYWEASLRMPSATGVFPAFWLLPEVSDRTRDLPRQPEIDIMEYIGEPGKYHVTAHTGHGDTHEPVSHTVNTGLDLTAEFHRYGVLKTLNSLVWYFDGQEVFRTRTKVDMRYDEDWYMLLNLAVGGDWPPAPVLSEYPDSLDVQWIRAYQRSNDQQGSITLLHDADDPA